MTERRSGDRERAYLRNATMGVALPCHRAADELLLRADRRRLLRGNYNAGQAVVMLDVAGRVVSWNRYAQRMHGFESLEVVGRHCSTFYCSADVEADIPQRDLGIARIMGRFEGDGWRQRKNGSHFPARVVCTAIHSRAGNLLGFAQLTEDLTLHSAREASVRTNATPMLESAMSDRVEHASLARALLECIAGVAQLALRHDIEVKARKLDMPCIVQAPRKGVAKVIAGLLKCAVAWCPPGGAVAVECSVSAPRCLRVAVRMEACGGRNSAIDRAAAVTVSRPLAESIGAAVGIDELPDGGTLLWSEWTAAACYLPQSAKLFKLPHHAAR